MLAITDGRCAIEGCATPYDRVVAHHLTPLADGGNVDAQGIALCHRHHQAIERAIHRARKARKTR